MQGWARSYGAASAFLFFGVSLLVICVGLAGCGSGGKAAEGQTAAMPHPSRSEAAQITVIRGGHVKDNSRLDRRLARDARRMERESRHKPHGSFCGEFFGGTPGPGSCSRQNR